MNILTFNEFVSESYNKPKQSSGLLMYKYIDNDLYVFIGKLGGMGWKDRSHNYSIPKGIIDKGEKPIDAAIREFEEETGIKYNWNRKDLVDLGYVDLKNPRYPKRLKLWAFEGDGKFKGSNTFKEEWPRNSGRYIISNEIEDADFYHIEKAKLMVHKYQVPALNRLSKK